MIESRALTGDDLALADVWEVAVHARPVALADSARGRMGAARELVEQAAHGRQEHTYGVNTGFGRFVSRSIPEELTEELQLRLLRSHACGVGEPYPDEVVRAAMLLRANALAKGYSGARSVTVELLSSASTAACCRACRAAALSAPAATSLRSPTSRCRSIGEGEATFEGRLLPGGEALARGRPRAGPAAGEGRAVAVNGTQFMAAFGALGLIRADRLAKTADVACAISLEALQGSRTSFLPQIHALRPLQGQSESAANVLRLLEDSAINEAHRWCDQVQDAYSLRCAPQVHGASRDLLAYVRETVAVELNAATDNPLVLVEDGIARLERQLPRPAARARRSTRWRWPSPSSRTSAERRVERLVNPSLSERPAGVPDRSTAA